MHFWILLIAVILILVYLYIQNNRATVNSYNIFIPRSHPALKGKKIVFISDTHFRSRISHSFIDHILIEIEEIAPDIILFGGDAIHRTTDETGVEHAKDFFAQLANIAPTYVVFGNHDRGSERTKEVAGALKRAGVTVLDDEATWISIDKDTPQAGFWLMGLNEYASSLQIKNAPVGKIDLPAGSHKEPKILLTHHPKFFEKYLANDETRPDLVLTGHAHGGQVILPLFGGVFAPGEGFNPTYDFGMFASDQYPDSRMIVTRGIGNSTFPLRINNRPEIVTIKLK